MEQGIQYKKHTAKPIIHSILYDGKGECGVVEEWKVEIGEKVKMNTVLGLVRTVQTTTAIRAHVKGIVKSILYPQGATVQNGYVVFFFLKFISFDYKLRRKLIIILFFFNF